MGHVQHLRHIISTRLKKKQNFTLIICARHHTHSIQSAKLLVHSYTNTCFHVIMVMQQKTNKAPCYLKTEALEGAMRVAKINRVKV